MCNAGYADDERLTRQTDARPGQGLAPRPGADVRYATSSASGGFYLREFSPTTISLIGAAAPTR